jgi:heme oxygenase
MAVDAMDGVDFDLDDLDEETIQKIVDEAPEVFLWSTSSR